MYLLPLSCLVLLSVLYEDCPFPRVVVLSLTAKSVPQIVFASTTTSGSGNWSQLR